MTRRPVLTFYCFIWSCSGTRESKTNCCLSIKYIFLYCLPSCFVDMVLFIICSGWAGYWKRCWVNKQIQVLALFVITRWYYGVNGVETGTVSLEEQTVTCCSLETRVRGQVLYAAVKCLQSGLENQDLLRYCMYLSKSHRSSMHGLCFLCITWV